MRGLVFNLGQLTTVEEGCISEDASHFGPIFIIVYPCWELSTPFPEAKMARTAHTRNGIKSQTNGYVFGNTAFKNALVITQHLLGRVSSSSSLSERSSRSSASGPCPPHRRTDGECASVRFDDERWHLRSIHKEAGNHSRNAHTLIWCWLDMPRPWICLTNKMAIHTKKTMDKTATKHLILP